MFQDLRPLNKGGEELSFGTAFEVVGASWNVVE